MIFKTHLANLAKPMHDQQRISARQLTRLSAFSNVLQSSLRRHRMARQQSLECRTESKPHATQSSDTPAATDPRIGFGRSETRLLRHPIPRRSGSWLAQFHSVVFLQNQRAALAAVVYARTWGVGRSRLRHRVRTGLSDGL